MWPCIVRNLAMFRKERRPQFSDPNSKFICLLCVLMELEDGGSTIHPKRRKTLPH
jgi:hypothetical protein